MARWPRAEVGPVTGRSNALLGRGWSLKTRRRDRRKPVVPDDFVAKQDGLLLNAVPNIVNHERIAIVISVIRHNANM